MADKSFAEVMAKKMAGGGGEDDAPPDSSADLDDGTGDAFKAACSSLIDAVHSKDADAVGDAFKQMTSLCPTGDDEDEGDDKGSGGHSALLLMPQPKGH